MSNKQVEQKVELVVQSGMISLSIPDGRDRKGDPKYKPIYKSAGETYFEFPSKIEPKLFKSGAVTLKSIADEIKKIDAISKKAKEDIEKRATKQLKQIMSKNDDLNPVIKSLLENKMPSSPVKHEKKFITADEDFVGEESFVEDLSESEIELTDEHESV